MEKDYLRRFFYSVKENRLIDISNASRITIGTVTKDGDFSRNLKSLDNYEVEDMSSFYRKKEIYQLSNVYFVHLPNGYKVAFRDDTKYWRTVLFNGMPFKELKILPGDYYLLTGDKSYLFPTFYGYDNEPIDYIEDVEDLDFPISSSGKFAVFKKKDGSPIIVYNVRGEFSNKNVYEKFSSKCKEIYPLKDFKNGDKGGYIIDIDNNNVPHIHYIDTEYGKITRKQLKAKFSDGEHTIRNLDYILLAPGAKDKKKEWSNGYVYFATRLDDELRFIYFSEKDYEPIKHINIKDVWNNPISKIVESNSPLTFEKDTIKAYIIDWTEIEEEDKKFFAERKGVYELPYEEREEARKEIDERHYKAIDRLASNLKVIKTVPIFKVNEEEKRIDIIPNEDIFLDSEDFANSNIFNKITNCCKRVES